MLDTPHIVETVAQAAAVIRFTIPRSEIQHVMGPAMEELLATVIGQGITPAGRIFSHHFAMHPDTFDFEVGIPVASPVTVQGRVKPGELPAARVVRTIYRGPYEGLGEAWGEFCDWIESEKLPTLPGLWESYLTGPDLNPDPSTYQTELNKLLAD